MALPVRAHPLLQPIELVLAGIALAGDDVWSPAAVVVLGGAGLAVRTRSGERQLTLAAGLGEDPPGDDRAGAKQCGQVRS